MTAVTAPAVTLPPVSGLHWVVRDSLTVARRNILGIVRAPELLVFSTIQPVMFVLLFRYVFGGAIRPPRGTYVDFLMPGIFVQTVAFGTTVTGVALAEDLSKGIIDRFRSLPMARSAVLGGRTLSDTLRGLFTVLLMLIVGVLVGLRFHVGALGAIGAVALVVVFGFCFSWISAYIGLAVRDVETAQVAGFVWLFPLTFASSAFVPLQSMPGWLQAFAKAQPITSVVDAARAMIDGGPTVRPVLYAVAWLAGILVVFVPLAVHNYRRVV